MSSLVGVRGSRRRVSWGTAPGRRLETLETRLRTDCRGTGRDDSEGRFEASRVSGKWRVCRVGSVPRGSGVSLVGKRGPLVGTTRPSSPVSPPPSRRGPVRFDVPPSSSGSVLASVRDRWTVRSTPVHFSVHPREPVLLSWVPGSSLAQRDVVTGPSSPASPDQVLRRPRPRRVPVVPTVLRPRTRNTGRTTGVWVMDPGHREPHRTRTVLVAPLYDDLDD